jgi:hypothetical protein
MDGGIHSIGSPKKFKQAAFLPEFTAKFWDVFAEYFGKKGNTRFSGRKRRLSECGR